MQQDQGEYGYVGVFFLSYILQAVPTHKILITKKRQMSTSASGHKSFYLTFTSNQKKLWFLGQAGILLNIFFKFRKKKIYLYIWQDSDKQVYMRQNKSN